MCWRRRVRSWSHCARREASRIRRLRYIWGGDDGREARGSGREDGFGESADMMGLVDGTVNWVPGGGAPFTSWSRSDMLDGLRGRAHAPKSIIVEVEELS